MILMLLVLSIGHTDLKTHSNHTATNNIIQSKLAFALIDEEITQHLNIGTLTDQEILKLRGPVLLRIRPAVHTQLREQFGRIVNTVDFGTQLGQGSHSESQPTAPILDPKVDETIRDFIAEKQIALIVMSNAPIGIAQEMALRGIQAEVGHIYHAIDGASVVLPIKNLTGLIQQHFVTEIWLDSVGQTTLDESVKDIGVDVVHNPASGVGVTGKDVIVAVVDTGIDQTHSEFRDNVIDEREDPINDAGIIDNHGTHVAGIIASDAGVAPDAKLLDGRMENLNLLRLEDIFLPQFLKRNDAVYSDTVDAIEWASHRKWLLNANEKADVINLSYAYPQWIYGREGNDPMSRLIDKVVSDDGVTFVVAAGNFAPRRATGTINPGSDPITHDFQVAYTDDLGNVTQTVSLILTLMWDDKDNDLDLAILDANGEEVTESRTNRGFILGKSYYEKSRYGKTKYYEQLKHDFQYQSQSNETYKFQIEATDVESSQAYELFIGGDYGYAIFDNPNREKTISVPGYSKEAITVGAVVSGSTVSDFSSRGPSDTNFIKPEVVAPGVAIASTLFNPDYGDKSGTSMAAPHVSGVAALILDAVGKNSDDDWNFTPDDVKSAIVRGAPTTAGITPNSLKGTGTVRADNIIFSNTVPADESLRYEITLRLTGKVFSGYQLNAEPILKVAISWENTNGNLDLELLDDNGNSLELSNSTASSYETIEGDQTPTQGTLYYLDVHNKSQNPVTFTGASTHPIEESESSPDTTTTQQTPNTEQTPISSTDDPPQESRLSATLRGHTDYVTSVAFSHNGDRLVSGSWDNSIRLWSTRTLQNYATGWHTHDVTSVAFSPDVRRIASSGRDKVIRIWDTTPKQLVVSRKSQTFGAFTSVVFIHHPNSGYYSVATANELDGDIDNFSYFDGASNFTYGKIGTHATNTLAVSPDLRMLASGGSKLDTNVVVWDPYNRKLLKTFKGHTDFITSVAFSPDSRTLASASWDNTVILWNISTGKATTIFRGHTDKVLSAAFSPDGRTIATGSDDKTIRLWDIASGQQKDTLLGHTSGVTALAFNPNRLTYMLASAGGWDKTVRLWDLSPAPTPIPTVRISPSPYVLPDVGDNLNVKLNILGVQDVAGYQATVHFDPTALRYVESANGTYLPSGSVFVPPVVSTNQVIVAATTLSEDSDGDGTLATLTFEVLAKKPSKITLSDVAVMRRDLTSIPIVTQGADIVVSTQQVLDVNGDGVVNIQDLIIVATHFGQEGYSQADVNRDNIVDIKDLLLVAGGISTDAAAPSMSEFTTFNLTVQDVQSWLNQTVALDLNEVPYQKGIAVLQQLLVLLTPKETALLPNYPNPFNPETWIPYQLATPANVTVSIYSADGKLIRMLDLGYRPVGIYQNRSNAAYWDGKNDIEEFVASGVYFYTLTAGEFSATRKMLIRK